MCHLFSNWWHFFHRIVELKAFYNYTYEGNRVIDTMEGKKMNQLKNIVLNDDTTAQANVTESQIGEIVTGIAHDENGNNIEVTGILTEILD